MGDGRIVGGEGLFWGLFKIFFWCSFFGDLTADFDVFGCLEDEFGEVPMAWMSFDLRSSSLRDYMSKLYGMGSFPASVIAISP